MKKHQILIGLILLSTMVKAQTCLRGNCTNGFGTLVFPNKSRYTGEFSMGWMTGRGIYYYSNGNKYMGFWQKNQKHGEGKLVYANGDIYSGKFDRDRITGFGSMVYKSGDKYVGEWYMEKPQGKGTYYYATGERFEGEFKLGKFEGKGKFYYTNGSYYDGDWKNDQRNGYGEFFDGKSKTLTGQWLNDSPLKVIETDALETVEDVVRREEGETEAEKIDNKPDTSVIIHSEVKEEKKENVIQIPDSDPPIFRDSTSQTTAASEDKLPNCNTTFCKSGKGTLSYADGSKYVGEFINGEPKGKGICYYANGDRYEGLWDNHAPHGEGVMYFKSGLIYGAVWDHGNAVRQLSSKQEFVYNSSIQKDQSAEVKIWAVIVGVSRYEHMPSLKYSDDDAYKIYAFLKSPEGGALPDEQIRLLIDEDATRNNILKALNEVSLKADENDVVMMYFSGHGLEGTFIPIDYNGYQNALKHDEIRELFNRSSAKHKVCYADACHSGSLLAAKSPFASELNYFYDELDKSSGGTAFMMSSKSKEYSLEDGGLRQGIFSHYLIRGLKGEADINKNKTITIRELFDWVSKNVKEYTGNAQSPLIAGDYDENMPVGFVRER